MAGETEQNVVAGDAGKTGKLVTRLLILSILIMVATPVITILAFRTMSRDVVKPAETEVELTEVALPRIQVNVAGTNASRYVQVDVVLRISDPSMLGLFDKQSSSVPNGKQREIVATAIRVIGDKPLNALLTTEGKQALANELKATFNDLLADATAGMITDVYFCGFLFQ